MDYVHGESLARLVRAMRARGEVVPPSITVAIMVGCSARPARRAPSEERARRAAPHRPSRRLPAEHPRRRGRTWRACSISASPRPPGNVQTTQRRAAQRQARLHGARATARRELLAPQTDIYAASVVLWEALTRRRGLQGRQRRCRPGQRAQCRRRSAESRGGFAHVDAATGQIVERLDPIVMRGARSGAIARRFATAREMSAFAGAERSRPRRSSFGERVGRKHRQRGPRGPRSADCTDIESSSSELHEVDTDADVPSAAGSSNVSVSANSPAREPLRHVAVERSRSPSASVPWSSFHSRA